MDQPQTTAVVPFDTRELMFALSQHELELTRAELLATRAALVAALLRHPVTEPFAATVHEAPIDAEFEIVFEVGAPGDALTPDEASDLAVELVRTLGATMNG